MSIESCNYCMELLLKICTCKHHNVKNLEYIQIYIYVYHYYYIILYAYYLCRMLESYYFLIVEFRKLFMSLIDKTSLNTRDIFLNIVLCLQVKDHFHAMSVVRLSSTNTILPSTGGYTPGRNPFSARGVVRSLVTLVPTVNIGITETNVAKLKV